MLAASAFNGALIDMTYNVFFKLKYDKLYDQMLATPLTTGDIARGEIAGASCAAASTPPVPAGDGRDGLLALVVGVLALPAAC
jgi:lipooligosaccharide transport system permease protein